SPDWIVGDMDSLGSESRLAKYPGERVVRHAAEKDHSDTEMALSLLWEKGCTKAKWNRAVERNGRWLRLKQEARRTLESEQHAELGK
ncbi:MAG: hypothetical protein LBQ69_00885, partial [Treponema sp.]|nr:hypothetical protein [Treponema sp.]